MTNRAFAILQATESAPADVWMDAAESSMSETARLALSSEECVVAGHSCEPPRELAGAYIQLLSDAEVVSFGVCGAPDVLRALAEALLGIDGNELSPADVTDAVGEIVNMLAGGVKRRLAAGRPGLQLGLPLFIHGHLEANERQQLRATRLRLRINGVARLVASCELTIVVMHERRMSPSQPAT